MLVIDSMMIPDDSLYIYYFCVAAPVLNAILIAPAAIRKGMSPNATKAVLHSKTKAITIPTIRQVRF